MRSPVIVVASAAAVSTVGLVCAHGRLDGAGTLSLELVDGATGRPLPGLVRIEDAHGRVVPLDGPLPRGFGMETPSGDWSVLVRAATLRVPRGRLRVEAFHGIETERAQVDVDLETTQHAAIRIPLVRFYDGRARGLRSGNTHVHMRRTGRAECDRYLREVSLADGLDVVFVSYLERAVADREYISNRYRIADLLELSKSGVLFGNGEEHRHNFGSQGEGYGHVMLLDIPKLVLPVSIGPGIMNRGTDGQPLRHGIDEARREGASVIWCHNTFGLEDIPNWVTGRPHAQNIFDGDPISEYGTYSDTFYRYLNAGLKVPFSTGTDWLIYDFSRVYVPVVDPPVTPRDWLRQLEAGRSFITNGPFLELEVGGAGPGSTVQLRSPGAVPVRARALGRVDFRQIELIRGGDVVETVVTRRERGHFVAELETDVAMPEPSWLALRTPPPPVSRKPEARDGFPESELGAPLFAHTSPVYVEVAGKRMFRPEVARGLLAEVERAREIVEKTAVFADAHERGHVLAVYAEAASALRSSIAGGLSRAGRGCCPRSLPGPREPRRRSWR